MIVLVVGMHRSGTSALAGMLHNNHIIMGNENKWHPKPSRENPKGFYENRDFRLVNDQILKENGYRVKDFDPAIPEALDLSEVMLTRMQQIIEGYDWYYKIWGWKDPRTCLTLGAWLHVLHQLRLDHQVRVLLPCRGTGDIADSMRARGNRERAAGQFEELVRAYSKCAMAALARYKTVKHLTVDFRRLIEQPRTVADELSEFIGHRVSDTSFIEPAIADRVRQAASG